MHTWSIGKATECRLYFDSPTRTRVNLDLCVDDGYLVRFLSVDTSPSTYFPLSQVEFCLGVRAR